MSTVDPTSGWSPIGEQEAKDWRQRAHDPKRLSRLGHRYEGNTAYRNVPQADEVDGNAGTIVPEGRGPVRPKEPREIVADMEKMLHDTGTANPDAYSFLCTVMRRMYPVDYGLMSDEELKPHIKAFVERASRQVVPKAYREAGWDRGHILDLKHIK